MICFKRTVFIFLIAVSPLLAKCKVDDRIMYSIAEIEKHPLMPIGYPYLISLNSKKDYDKLNNNEKNLMLDKRTIDCNDLNTCSKILEELIKKNIKNVDCGAFQINYRYWKRDFGDYFKLRKSYEIACDIIHKKNVNKWSWVNIAKYHSATPKYNEKYKKRLIASIKRNINK